MRQLDSQCLVNNNHSQSIFIITAIILSMKLQIISRITKNQHQYHPSSLQTSSLYQAFPLKSHQQQDALHFQYYSIKTSADSSHNNHNKREKENTREFFNSFNSNCTVIYESLSETNHYKHYKRRVRQQLQQITTPGPNHHSQLTFNKLSSNRTNHHIQTQQPLSPIHLTTYHQHNPITQKAHQKIRKINSLIVLHNHTSQGEQLSKRKPGFIKRIKSLSKKDICVHSDHDRGNNNNNMQRKYSSCNNDSTNDNTANTSKIHNDSMMSRVVTYQSVHTLNNYTEQMKQSKERIAKIRRQLNGIYQMRKPSHRLQLK